LKPEEHDELKENDLAGWLQVGLWTFLKQNGSYLLLAAALTFLGFQLWRLHKQRQTQELWTAWADLHEAEQGADVTKMFDVIDKHKQKAVQAQAYLWLGDTYDRMILAPAWLDEQKLTRDESLDKSRENYEAALAAADGDSLITGWARLGLAAVDEDHGDWDKAKTEYQTVAGKGSDYGSAMANLAKERLDGLDERRAAPRLAAMLPPPSPPKPASASPTLSLTPGAAPTPAFPGLLNSPFSGSVSIPTTAPAATSPGAFSLPPLSPLGPTLMPNAPALPAGAGSPLPPPGGLTLPGSGSGAPESPTTQK